MINSQQNRASAFTPCPVLFLNTASGKSIALRQSVEFTVYSLTEYFTAV